MDIQQFKIKLADSLTTLSDELQTNAPIIVGKTAVDFFKEGFQHEGFTDNSLNEWDEVNRRGARGHKVAEGARGTRKILTGDTADLGESIQYKALDGEVEVFSDLPYAQAHNKGTDTAGRGHNVHIPQRQFIGPSAELYERIANDLESVVRENLKG